MVVNTNTAIEDRVIEDMVSIVGEWNGIELSMNHMRSKQCKEKC